MPMQGGFVLFKIKDVGRLNKIVKICKLHKSTFLKM